MWPWRYIYIYISNDITKLASQKVIASTQLIIPHQGKGGKRN